MKKLTILIILIAIVNIAFGQIDKSKDYFTSDTIRYVNTVEWCEFQENKATRTIVKRNYVYEIYYLNNEIVGSRKYKKTKFNYKDII